MEKRILGELPIQFIGAMELGNKVIMNVLLVLMIIWITGCEDQLMDKTIDWRKDKDGCLGLRSKGYFEQIIGELEQMESKNLKKYLGSPNEVVKDEFTHYLYYFESFCLDGQYVDSLDHNTVLLRLDKERNRLISYSYMFP